MFIGECKRFTLDLTALFNARDLNASALVSWYRAQFDFDPSGLTVRVA